MKLDKHLTQSLNKSLDECFKGNQVDLLKLKRLTDFLKSLPSLSLAINLLKYCLNGVRLRLSRGDLRIESAVPLTKLQINQIEELISRKHFVYNTKVWVNPGYLGGMKIQIGDKVIDNTVLGKIGLIGETIHG